MFNNFNNLNLTWKINLIIALIILLIMSVIAYAIYNYATDILLNEVNNKIDIMTDYQKKLLNEIVERKYIEIKEIPESPIISLYTDYAFYIKRDEQLNNSVNRRDFGNYTFKELINSSNLVRQTGTKLKSMINEIDYASIAYITTPDGTVIADSRYTMKKKASDNISTGKVLSLEEYEDINFGNLVYVNDTPILLLNRPILNEDGLIGYFVVGLNTKIFSENLDTFLGKYGNISLINNQGIILNHQNNKLIGKKSENSWYLKQLKNGQEEKQLTNDNYNILSKMPGNDLYFAINIAVDQINAPANKMRDIIIKLSFIGIIIMFFIVSIVIKWQLIPLNILLGKMEKVSQGNMNTQITVKRKDEIGKLANNFNKMVKEIKNLLKEVKNDQQEIRKKEFEALQSQINPHFLYNTLDFIYWMAEAKEYKAIGKMAVSLSKFFRLALNNGSDITTVGKEIKHVNNYLVIQKLRYPDKFISEINVDPGIYHNECIKLIIQPLVENALIHGLKNMEEGGEVRINGVRHENFIKISVHDNGCGFNVNKMENILQQEKNSSSCYALYNVHNRIRLYYGKDYGLYFSKSALGGACVGVKLPIKINKDDVNVQNGVSR